MRKKGPAQITTHQRDAVGRKQCCYLMWYQQKDHVETPEEAQGAEEVQESSDGLEVVEGADATTERVHVRTPSDLEKAPEQSSGEKYHETMDPALRYAEMLLSGILTDVKPEGTREQIGGDIETWHHDEASLGGESELELDDDAIERIGGRIYRDVADGERGSACRERIVESLRKALKTETEYQHYLKRKESEEAVL